MTKLSKIKDQINVSMETFGFTGRSGIWNRRVEDFIDVLELQFDKARNSFTLNIGVADTVAFKLCSGKEPPELLEQPMCTVSARLGELLDGKDKWWTIDDPVSIGAAVDNIEMDVLPFYEKMHERKAMRQYLLDSRVPNKRYPLPIINLAILEMLVGQTSASHKLLEELMRKTSQPWCLRANEVQERVTTYLHLRPN